MIREDEVYRIGTITRTHGTQGEVSMTFTDDVWDRTDTDYLVLCMDGIMVPVYMESYRFRSDTVVLIKFQDYDTSEEAVELCGTQVFFPLALAQAPTENGYTWQYFTGFRVDDVEAGTLGVIEHVEDSTANVLFQVGDRLLPAAEELILNVDHEQRILTMQLPSGLLEL